MLRHCVVIGLLLGMVSCSGCVLNLRVIPDEDPKAVREEERAYQESLTNVLTKEEKILQSFGDSGIILKAFKEIGANVVDVGGFLNEYGKTDMEGFCEYLRKQYPLTTKPNWWLDREIFDPAKRLHNLFEEVKDYDMGN